MTTTTTYEGFEVEASTKAQDYNLPQKMGRALWAPMWVMGIAGLLGGTITAMVRGSAIANGEAPTTIAALNHLEPGLQFFGFMAVFTGISFAIARILGAFRTGGGQVQETAGRRVLTLKMLPTAKIFIGIMAMAMMGLVGTTIAHLIYAANTASGSVSLQDSASAAVVLEGFRRFFMGSYLFAIAFGLATITKVLRFQATRIRALPNEQPA